MNAKDTSLNNFNRIAETQFFLRPVIENSLKTQSITEQGKPFVGGANTYYEYWTRSFNDKFFDMGTFIRLGTEIENTLKYYYMEKKSHQNMIDLKNDPYFKLNIFQRVLPWSKNSALELYKNELDIDLTLNSKLNSIQEIMYCRHLFAHNCGLLTDDFIANFHRLTGIDILTLPSAQTYPSEDTYYFEPLKKLDKFIEESRKFVKELP